MDQNNETFANGDSVGPLTGLTWGLTLPEDIASDQVGGRKERMKSKRKSTGDQQQAGVSPIFFSYA